MPMVYATQSARQAPSFMILKIQIVDWHLEEADFARM